MRLKKRLSTEHDVSNRKDFDIVIIGNGPSAIMLSYFLSGHWPYYNGKPIDDPVLTERLKYVSQSKSLVMQDLEWLSDGLYDPRTMNPVSILLDHLYHPNADMLTNDESVIEWRYNSDNEVRHVVLGLGPAGGSWHRMSNSQLTVSLARWLELPEYPFSKWYQENESELCNLPKLQHEYGVHHERTNAAYIGLYYSDYVKHMNLSQNFINNIKVTSVTQSNDNSLQWEIEGMQYADDQTNKAFSVNGDNVALAVGAFHKPQKLGIPGEHYAFVHHKFPDPDSFLSRKCPVLVVGCGLVALDAVLTLMSKQIPVYHVFRRSVKDPALIVNQLSSAYADYLKLKPLMTNKSQVNEYYTPYPQHILSEILPNKEVIIESINKKTSFTIHVSKVIVHIGLLPDLSCIANSDILKEEPDEDFNIKTNPINVNLYTYESKVRRGLYTLGPLVGDNFVRFISGGALGITHGLFRNECDDSE